MISKNTLLIEDGLATLLCTGELASSKRGELFSQMLASHPSASSRAILALFSKYGESAELLTSAWNAIRLAEKTTISSKMDCLDTCGTGGDGSDSINLSTLSSLVMAASGIFVLKHGNRAITSKCGSSDLLNAFGYDLNQKPSYVLSSVKKIKMGYFHAPSVHPIYAKFQMMRKSIKVRTFFNLLGPLLNPVPVKYQLLGVAQKDLLNIYQEILPKIGRKRSIIFMGHGGMDEITSLGSTQGVLVEKGKSKAWSLNPKHFGFRKGKRSELEITSVSHAKNKAIDVLKNKKKGTARDSVVLSAAVGIYIADSKSNMKESIQRAAHAIDSGKSWDLLTQMVRISKQ